MECKGHRPGENVYSIKKTKSVKSVFQRKEKEKDANNFNSVSNCTEKNLNCFFCRMCRSIHNYILEWCAQWKCLKDDDAKI